MKKLYKIILSIILLIPIILSGDSKVEAQLTTSKMNMSIEGEENNIEIVAGKTSKIVVNINANSEDKFEIIFPKSIILESVDKLEGARVEENPEEKILIYEGKKNEAVNFEVIIHPNVEEIKDKERIEISSKINDKKAKSLQLNIINPTKYDIKNLKRISPTVEDAIGIVANEPVSYSLEIVSSESPQNRYNPQNFIKTATSKKSVLSIPVPEGFLLDSVEGIKGLTQKSVGEDLIYKGDILPMTLVITGKYTIENPVGTKIDITKPLTLSGEITGIPYTISKNLTFNEQMGDKQADIKHYLDYANSDHTLAFNQDDLQKKFTYFIKNGSNTSLENINSTIVIPDGMNATQITTPKNTVRGKEGDTVFTITAYGTDGTYATSAPLRYSENFNPNFQNESIEKFDIKINKLISGEGSYPTDGYDSRRGFVIEGGKISNFNDGTSALNSFLEVKAPALTFENSEKEVVKMADEVILKQKVTDTIRYVMYDEYKYDLKETFTRGETVKFSFDLSASKAREYSNFSGVINPVYYIVTPHQMQFDGDIKDAIIPKTGFKNPIIGAIQTLDDGRQVVKIEYTGNSGDKHYNKVTTQTPGIQFDVKFKIKDDAILGTSNSVAGGVNEGILFSEATKQSAEGNIGQVEIKDELDFDFDDDEDETLVAHNPYWMHAEGRPIRIGGATSLTVDTAVKNEKDASYNLNKKKFGMNTAVFKKGDSNKGSYLTKVHNGNAGILLNVLQYFELPNKEEGDAIGVKLLGPITNKEGVDVLYSTNRQNNETLNLDNYLKAEEVTDFSKVKSIILKIDELEGKGTLEHEILFEVVDLENTQQGKKVKSFSRVQGNSKENGSRLNITTKAGDIIIQKSLKNELQYNGNGNEKGSVPKTELYAKNKVVKVATKNDLAKSGFEFTGWNTQKNGEGRDYKENDNLKIQSDITLYAKWTPLKYGVEYNSNYGIGDKTERFNYSYNERIKIKDENELKISKLNHNFIGWNTLENGTGISYTPNSDINITKDLKLHAQWEKNKYTITYVKDDSTMGEVPNDENKYEHDSQAIIQSKGNLNKPGFEFIGWNSKADGSGKNYKENDSLKIRNDITLYGNWKQIGYKITYNTNDGIDDENKLFNYSYNERVKIKNINELKISKLNHNFIGWNTLENGTGIFYAPNSDITITEDLNLYAQWEKNQYEIIYFENGATSGEKPKDQKKYGYNDIAVIKSQESLIKDGNKFVGWNTLENGVGINYTPNTNINITEDLNLYAQWEKNKYKITYVKDDSTMGEVPTDENEYEYNSSAKIISKRDLNKVGFEFIGWNTKIDGSGINFAENDSLKMTTNITLYGNWKPLKYKLSYNSNDGINDDKKVVNNYVYNELIVIKDNETLGFTKDGHKFIGWNTNKDGTMEQYEAKSKINLVDNLVLYAQWAPNIYGLRYDTNDGISQIESYESMYPHGSSVKVAPKVSLERPGYIFMGWNTLPNGFGVRYKENDIIKMLENLTLYAEWKEEKYKINYIDNNATGKIPIDSNRYKYNDKATIKDQGSLKRIGYKFMGWNTLENGSGKIYEPSSIVDIKENIYLYGQWKEEEYKITYVDDLEMNDEPPIDDNIYHYNDEATILGKVLKNNGYKFIGWSREIDGKNEILQENEKIIINDNTTLNAVYTKDLVDEKNNLTPIKIPNKETLSNTGLNLNISYLVYLVLLMLFFFIKNTFSIFKKV